MGTLFQTLGLSPRLGLVLGFSLLTLPSAAAEEVWQCRLIDLRDGGAGNAIHGIEDIDVDRTGDMAYLSAHNRRKGDVGALYALHREWLQNMWVDGSATLNPLNIEGGASIRPHGIAVEAEGHLFVIDRQKGQEPFRPQIRHFARTGNEVRLVDLIIGGDKGDEICNANDLIALHDGHVYITLDRSACRGMLSFAQKIFGTASGSVLRWKDGVFSPFADEIRFANGIASWRGEILVAETRGDRVHRYDKDGNLLGHIELPAAPDNLSVGTDGALYVAAFPSLFGYFRFRQDIDERDASPSQVFRVAPDDLSVEMLDLNPERLPAGASVAVRWEQWLLVGAAYDTGLGLCKMSS